MSEAMSSVEIEDVLSSIRRLVSEDLRPGAKAGAAKKPDEKFILTPAFRVVAESGVEGQSDSLVSKQDTTVVARATLPRLHLGAEPVIEELVATLERAVEAQDIEWESEVGDPAPMVTEAEWTENGWVALDNEIQDDVAKAPSLGDELHDAATPSWAQDDPEQSVEIEESAASTPELPIAEPDEYWADQAEAEAVAELRDTSTADDASLFVSNGTEMSFDEEVLRDLVRDLIREELQGGLGERITRNVRKLVRAEIARAIAAQDIE
jgi:hypothetical protein